MSHSTMSAQDYPLPAVSRMNALNEDFIELLNTGTETLLPVFREKLVDLSSALQSTERFLFEQVSAVLVLLDNHQWSRVDELLEETRRLPSLDDAQRDAVVRNREQDLEQDARRDFQRLEVKGQEIAEKLRVLGAFKLPLVGQRATSLAEQRNALKDEISVQTRRVQNLDAQIADMTLVINTFEAPGLMKIFNGLIPTQQEIELVIKTLATNTPSVDLLKAASEKFTRNLATLMEGRKLIDLIQRRNGLVSERGTVCIELASWEARQARLDRELEQLANVRALDDLRSQWLEQALVLSHSWSEQMVVMKQQTSPREVAERLSQMAHYLLAVRRLREAA